MGREAGMGVANTQNHNFNQEFIWSIFQALATNQTNEIVIGAFEWGGF
jgi:hypothetical protein